MMSRKAFVEQKRYLGGGILGGRKERSWNTGLPLRVSPFWQRVWKRAGATVGEDPIPPPKPPANATLGAPSLVGPLQLKEVSAGVGGRFRGLFSMPQRPPRPVPSGSGFVPFRLETGCLYGRAEPQMLARCGTLASPSLSLCVGPSPPVAPRS